MQVDFYQLVAPVDRVLPSIAQRVMEGGGRLLVVSDDAEMRTRLDERLWTYRADAFLPHGMADAATADRQPVLLSATADPVNGARHIALADGRWRDEALAFDRAFHFFDDRNVGEARQAWKALADREGVERRYWKQDESGRWMEAG